MKHDVVTRNAGVGRVADFLHSVADDAGLSLPREELMEVLSHDSMSAAALLHEVMLT